jgi:hypothetical protein
METVYSSETWVDFRGTIRPSLLLTNIFICNLKDNSLNIVFKFYYIQILIAFCRGFLKSFLIRSCLIALKTRPSQGRNMRGLWPWIMCFAEINSDKSLVSKRDSKSWPQCSSGPRSLTPYSAVIGISICYFHVYIIPDFYRKQRSKFEILKAVRYVSG